MRVLFINTIDQKGGAGIVATRLKAELMMRFGVSCQYLVARKTFGESSIVEIQNGASRFFEKIINMILNLIGLQYQWFPFTTSVILNKAKEFQPDIISLHNTHGGYFQTSLLTKLSVIAPVVWTLHDMWSFSGNAAHTFGDESWKVLKNSNHLKDIYPKIGINAGSFLLRQKKKIYAASNISIVTPSVWLLDLAKQSPVFANKNICQIYNGVDLEIFKPKSRLSKNAVNLKETDKVLMFSAEFLKDNIWKGGQDLIDVLKAIDTITTIKIHLIITGSGPLLVLDNFSNLVIHQIGYISTAQEMAKYFAACDLFMYPTRADNLPNVLIESIACGTPCVTFDVGGSSEIILNGYNGLVIEPFDIKKMAESVSQLLNNDEQLNRLALNARKYSEEIFSIEKMGKLYYELFTTLVLK